MMKNMSLRSQASEKVPCFLQQQGWRHQQETEGEHGQIGVQEDTTADNWHSPENPSPNKIREIKFCFQYEKEMTTASNHRLESKSFKTEKLVPMKAQGGQSLAPALADTMHDINFLKSQYLSLENSTK